MKKLVFIDCCIRQADSRTRALAVPILDALSDRYEITAIDLTVCAPEPITREAFLRRGTEGLSPADLANGKLVADADCLVIAAPFWDMSFPSALKAFFEHISACGVTFQDNPDGTTRGCCKAETLLYITTRGMDIPTGSPLDQGTSYLQALAWLWGIGKVETVAAWGMDVCDAHQRTLRLAEAQAQGLKLCKEL